MNWHQRIYTRAQAADISGLHPSTLAGLVHRMRHADVLFSERQGGRRMFSARDIATLRVAYELERGGQTWLTALARAFERLTEPPPHDALLVTPVTSVAARSSVVTTGPQTVAGHSVLIVPIGAIVADVLEKVGRP